ncbi:hypothetical protein Tco_1194834 [Tanacetum coccineum]
MKVVAEMVNEAEVQISRRKEFLKHQESHLQVLSKAHNEKLKKKAELKNKSYDNYVWTITSRKKPEKINEIYIHLRTRPITITIYRNNNPRNFKVLKNFKFGDFSLSEWDERNAINPKKSKRKKKAIELEPETYIAGLHCNKTLPEGVKFMKNLVIEKPRHGLFFIDAF